MIYLLEPYNAYVKDRKPKHPFEIAEEEALFVKMMQEAKNPVQQTAPQISVAVIGPSAVGGAGGSPVYGYFHPYMALTFTASSTVGLAPFTTQFIPLAGEDVLNNCAFLWNFGDGTTSTEVRPVKTYSITGSYKVSVTASGFYNSSDIVMYGVNNMISSSMPTVTADFTSSARSGSKPLTVTFTNLSTNATTYKWLFGDHPASSSTETNPVYTYNTTGSFSVKLEATGSFNSKASVTKLWISSSL